MKFPLLCGVNTSFALSLRAWRCDASISSNSSMSATRTFPIRFLPRIMHIQGIHLARLLGQNDVVSISLWQKQGDIRKLLQTVLLVRERVLRTAFHMVSSHQTRDLENFTDSSKIPSNPPTIHCPDLIATIPQMSLLSLCALLFRQSNLFLICVVLTYNDSRIVLHRICQIPRNCQCK